MIFHSSQPNIFQVLTKEIAESIFELNETLFEDAYQQSLKLLVALSSQYPPMSESYRTALLAKKKTSNGDQATHAQQASSNCAAKTEISERFVAIDRARGDGGALQQALLYVLNENNYPNLSYAETKVRLAPYTFALVLMSCYWLSAYHFRFAFVSGDSAVLCQYLVHGSRHRHRCRRKQCQVTHMSNCDFEAGYLPSPLFVSCIRAINGLVYVYFLIRYTASSRHSTRAISS